MLKITTRLFAASTLAAMLICVNQGAFAAGKTAKTAVKTSVKVVAKIEAKCAMCAQEGVKVAAKSGKPVAKAVTSVKIAPGASVVKTSVVKTSVVKTSVVKTSAKTGAAG